MPDLHVVVNGPFQENCWVVGDGEGRGFVVDPGFELDRVLATAERAGIEIVKIVNTHGHLDHACGVAELKERLGVPFAMHPADRFLLQRLEDQAALFGLERPEVPEIDEELADGMTLRIGALEIEVVHTPGHTPGGCCLLLGGHAIVGDTLFAGSIGRTDLPGGSWQAYQGTLRKLLTWPDETVVHSGHGPDTTIGEERWTNPFLIDVG